MSDEPDKTTSIPVDLRLDGILWLVNTSVLHPRGFALAVDTETGALTLMGNGTEPWVFLDGTGDEPFAAVEALFERARVSNKP